MVEDSGKSLFDIKYGFYEHVRIGLRLSGATATYAGTLNLGLLGPTWMAALAFLDYTLVSV